MYPSHRVRQGKAQKHLNPLDVKGARHPPGASAGRPWEACRLHAPGTRQARARAGGGRHADFTRPAPAGRDRELTMGGAPTSCAWHPPGASAGWP